MIIVVWYDFTTAMWFVGCDEFFLVTHMCHGFVIVDELEEDPPDSQTAYRLVEYETFSYTDQ